ncbi:MAG: hypothetical protein NVSMB42_04750 [Herpetosiphon sp.]
MPSYYIRVRGHLPDRYTSWFDNMNITRQPSGETLLAGELVDQSALFGVLLKIRDLGIPLLAVVSDSGQTVPGIGEVMGPESANDTASKHQDRSNYVLMRICEAAVRRGRRFRTAAMTQIGRSWLGVFHRPGFLIQPLRYAVAVV